MRYDYGRVSGYAYMRRTAALTIPRNYEIRFKMRGTGGRNDLQMKLTDGDNVWWKVWRNLRPSTQWQEVVVPAGVVGEVALGKHSDAGRAWLAGTGRSWDFPASLGANRLASWISSRRAGTIRRQQLMRSRATCLNSSGTAI